MHIKDGLITFGKLLTPSLVELLSAFSIFVILIIGNQVHHQYSEDLTSLSAATFNGTIFNGPAHWLSTLYASDVFSTAAVYIFWMFIALLVYILAFRLAQNAEEIVKDISIRRYIWPRSSNKNKPLEEYIEKFGMKFIVLVVICLYVIKLSSILVKWWKLHYIFANTSLHAITIYATLLVFVELYVHGIVVLIRALILRQRIINI